MKKSIETDGKNYTIRTVNGVDTKTGAVWTKQIKVFKPLENGFNLALANEVYDIISHYNFLWDQGDWRRVLWTHELNVDDREIVKQMAAFEVDLNKPTCGTAMCFAGWVSELSGADYLLDAKGLQERDIQDDGRRLDVVLVARDTPNLDKVAFLGMDRLEESVLATLRERGFTPETHYMMEIAEYALLQLGLTEGDGLDLFDGNNPLDVIRNIIDAYAQDGPSAVQEWGDEYDEVDA